MANGIVLNIDTTKSEFQNPMVQLRQGDGNYQSLAVTVTSNGEPLNLTGWTVTFMGTTAGGFKIVDSAVTVTNALQGEFTYTPTKAWGQDQGEFKNAYFKFTKADETASGASFRVNVLDAVDLTADEAKDYISVVDALIDDVKTSMDNKLAETKQTLADTQSQANSVQENVNDLNTNVNELKSQNNNIKTSDNTWTGTNTFNKKIIAITGVQGNADTATKLQTPRKLKVNLASTADKTFDGSADQVSVGVSGVLPIVNGGTGRNDGLADAANKLATARTIALTGDVTGSGTFDGSGDLSISAVGTSTTIKIYGLGTYFVNDTATDGDHLTLIVSGKVVSVQGSLMTKVEMSGGRYLNENLIPAQYAPMLERKNTVGFNANSAVDKIFADVAWGSNGDISIDNIVNGSNMTAWGTIPAGSRLSFADTWVLA